MKDEFGFVIDEKLVGIAEVFSVREQIDEKERIIEWIEFLKQHSISLIDFDEADDAASKLVNSAKLGLDIAAALSSSNDEIAMQFSKLVRKGVPSCIRGLCWRTFLDTSVRRISGYYRDLVDTSLGGLQDRPGEISPDEIRAQAEATTSLLGEDAKEKESQEHWQAQGRKWLLQIEKDLPRTFPGHPSLSKASGWAPLRRILAAYAMRNKAVGYCQSINFLAGCLLLFLDEEDAFFALCAVIDDILPYYSPDMTRVQEDSLAFKRLVQNEFPAISRRMDEAGPGADVSTVCFVQWLLCIFLNSLPLSSALRVWDVLLYEKSPSIIFKVALSLIEIYSPALHAVNDEVDAFQVMHEMAPMTFDANRLIHTAYSSKFSHIDDERLNDLRAEARRLIVSPPKETGSSSKPPLHPHSNEEGASEEGVVSSLVKIGMNKLDQLRQRLEKGSKAATPLSLSPSQSFINVKEAKVAPPPYCPPTATLPDLMDFGDDETRKGGEGDGVLVIPEIDDLLHMPMEEHQDVHKDVPPPPPAPIPPPPTSSPPPSSSPPIKAVEMVLKPKTSDAARLALAIASTPFTPPPEATDGSTNADWVDLSTTSLPPSSQLNSSATDDKDVNSNMALIAQAVKNAGQEAAKSIMNALANVRQKGSGGCDSDSPPDVTMRPLSIDSQVDSKAMADSLCEQLGIKDVLSHRSKLHEESQYLLMPVDAQDSGLTVLDHLVALQKEVVAIGTTGEILKSGSSKDGEGSPRSMSPDQERLDKSLLLLADAQKRAEAEDGRTKELQNALSSISCVSELMDEQIRHLLTMMVERNQMLEAMARKEGEATARLALQDGEVADLRERNRELEHQLKVFSSSQGGGSTSTMPWGRFFPSKS